MYVHCSCWSDVPFRSEIYFSLAIITCTQDIIMAGVFTGKTRFWPKIEKRSHISNVTQFTKKKRRENNKFCMRYFNHTSVFTCQLLQKSFLEYMCFILYDMIVTFKMQKKYYSSKFFIEIRKKCIQRFSFFIDNNIMSKLTIRNSKKFELTILLQFQVKHIINCSHNYILIWIEAAVNVGHG